MTLYMRLRGDQSASPCNNVNTKSGSSFYPTCRGVSDKLQSRQAPIWLCIERKHTTSDVCFSLEVEGKSLYEACWDLNWCLSMPRVRIFVSSVERGIPSLAAAPDGPATRPRLS